MKHQIVVLGPLPPPYGGVSVHIVRFLELLKSEGVRARALAYTGTTRSGRTAKVLQAARMLACVYFRRSSGARSVLHVHYGGFGYFLALAPLLYFSRARKVITFHSVRVLQDLAKQSLIMRHLTLALLDRFALFVAVRTEIGDDLRTLGLTGPEITVMPAFLPPAPQEQDLRRLPPGVSEELVAAQEAGAIQICCGAYYLGPGYGHDDLYGVQELAQSLGQLGEVTGPGIDVWVLVSNEPSSEAQVRAETAIREAVAAQPGVRLHLHFGLPLIPVMSRCAGFLRPSREDGDSVAIREALALGVPVLASDVVTRPEGVQTYRASGGLLAVLPGFIRELNPVPSGTVRGLGGGNGVLYREFVAEVLGDAR